MFVFYPPIGQFGLKEDRIKIIQNKITGISKSNHQVNPV